MTVDNDDNRLDPRNRLDNVATSALRPESLVGSFFHTDAERGWQGCVVAEPAAGVYLVELFSWLTDHLGEQRLVRLDDMVESGWHFYDDADWMDNAYKNGLSDRWERERAKIEEP